MVYLLVELVLGIAFTKTVSHIGFSLSMEGGDMYSFTYHLFNSYVK